MSNATNRTLSANLNRLNLGTRNRDLAVVNGDTTLVLRPHVWMRTTGWRSHSRVEAQGIDSPRPILPIPPKPMGWKKKSQVDLGTRSRSRLESSVSSSPLSAVASLQERFTSLGFSAFDLSTSALRAGERRIESGSERQAPRTVDLRSRQGSQCRQAQTEASYARAARRASTYRVGAPGRSVRRLEFLEPSASSS